MNNKLIIIRGNSASGKSTVANLLRQRSGRKIAYVEQDYIRRVVLKEAESDGGDNIELIKLVVEYSLSHGYDVILEGILKFQTYGKMLEDLTKAHSNNFVFYFDIPFDESVKRHATKPIAHDIDTATLKKWFIPHDVTGLSNEIIVPHPYSVEETVNFITSTAGL